MEFAPKLPETNVNITHESPVREFATLTAGLVAVMVGVYFVLGLFVDWGVERMAPNLEQETLGGWSLGIDEDTPPNPKTQVLQHLVDALNEQCAHLPYQFRVIAVPDAETINAMALPGGTILVYEGLLRKMESENALVFVLGHELGHFRNRDHLKGMGRLLVLITLSTLLLGPDNPINGLFDVSVGLGESAHSRRQEEQADRFGLDIVQCRYGHVTGAGQFFETMQKEQHLAVWRQFFASHPADLDRIQNLHTLAKQAGYRQGELKALEKTLSQ